MSNNWMQLLQILEIINCKLRNTKMKYDLQLELRHKKLYLKKKEKWLEQYSGLTQISGLEP